MEGVGRKMRVSTEKLRYPARVDAINDKSRTSALSSQAIFGPGVSVDERGSTTFNVAG